jgi:quinol monooxygenase YgiN
VEAAMHARSTFYVVKPEKYDDFLDALSQSVPLMRQQKGFHSLLVMRSVGTAQPELRVMTVWESQQALQDSERNVYFYQAVTRALAFSSGFPRILEEEIVLSDFPD